jgi:hypothetical protein
MCHALCNSSFGSPPEIQALVSASEEVEQIRKEGAFSFFLAWRVTLWFFSLCMAKIYSLRRKSLLALRQRKATVLRQLRVRPDSMRASFVERYTKCGKPNCRCHLQGAKHGPFYFLTQCLAVGKVQKFLLKSPTQREEAKQGIDHFNEFYELLEELSQINAELLRRDQPLTPGS